MKICDTEFVYCIFLIILFGFEITFCKENDTNFLLRRSENFALQKSTIQSSTLDPSHLAVDGSTTTCSNTQEEEKPNWTVDLGSIQPIVAVFVNNGDKAFGSNYEVHIGPNTSSFSLCNFGAAKMELTSTHHISCIDENPKIRYVRIINNFNKLRLCEVRVMVCKNGFFGSNCEKQCKCHGSQTCDKSNGQCQGLCAEGRKGIGCQQECETGTFGASCLLQCHCINNQSCDTITGKCASACHPNWVGASCQTEIPHLHRAPQMVEAGASRIVLRWDGWTGYVDDDMALMYEIEYRQVHDIAVVDNSNFDNIEDSSKNENNVNDIADNSVDSIKINKDRNDECNSRTDCEHNKERKGVGKEDEIKNEFTDDTQEKINEIPETKGLKYNINEEKNEKEKDGESFHGEASDINDINRDTNENNHKLEKSVNEKKKRSKIIENTNSIASVNEPITKESNKESKQNDVKYNDKEALKQKSKQGEWKVGGLVDHGVVEFSIRNLSINSYYQFRVTPILMSMDQSPLVRGRPSPLSQRFKTMRPVRALAVSNFVNNNNKHLGNNYNIIIIASTLVISIICLLLLALLLVYRKQMLKYKSLSQQDNEALKSEVLIGHIEEKEVKVENRDVPDEFNNSIVTVPPPFMHTRIQSIADGKNRLREVPTPEIPINCQPIRVEDLRAYVEKGKLAECFLFKKEYKEIPSSNNEASTKIGNINNNKHKNRFVNILPYDHTRVVLQGGSSDYINASYIDGYKKPKAYIAAQGCNKHSIEDMWRMVHQTGASRVVMVTNLVEKGRVKCEQYWSDEENTEVCYGGMKVVLRGVEETVDYTIRTFELSAAIKPEQYNMDDDGGGYSRVAPKGVVKDDSVVYTPARVVRQFHFTAWPDHGVPDKVWPLISFHRRVRQYDTSTNALMVVHCSAGVGRTGTFIALDYLLEEAADIHSIDLFRCTTLMRRSRMNMIQTFDQYLFVYDALLEALTLKDTTIISSKFESSYKELLSIAPDGTAITKLEQEFQLLDAWSYKEVPTDCEAGRLEENVHKNRDANILPGERHRACLQTRVPGTNDYINAVYIDGYRKRNSYIGTQMPLPHTVIDLWRLVYEVKAGTIIMLNTWQDNDETYGQYWPEENEECECGPFIIEASSIINDHPYITIRELTLTFDPNNNNNISDADNKNPSSTPCDNSTNLTENNKNTDNNNDAKKADGNLLGEESKDNTASCISNVSNTNDLDAALIPSSDDLTDASLLSSNKQNGAPEKQEKVQQQTVNHFQLNIPWPSNLNKNDQSSAYINVKKNIQVGTNADNEDGYKRMQVALLSLLQLVEKSQIKTGDAPIIIHCRDGLTHTGLVVAVAVMLERLKHEQAVEVMQVVRRLRLHRPSALVSLDQYKFCYDMALAYLQDFSIYSNFK